MSNSLPLAYSHLPQILAKCHLKISELRKKLKSLGVNVNPKSLYRLTSPAPLQRIDARIVGAICQTCAVGIEDVITFEPPKPAFQKLSGIEQKRLDDLMSKHTEEKLSAAETRELDALSAKAHELTMANARMLVAQRRALNPARNPRPVAASVRARPNQAVKRADSSKNAALKPRAAASATKT